ncbi:hypothetical protein GGR56DRAFT_65240 [Xylariaceae sp. FL0804]|nr:hypothetical protein GGR56DRAFT_65240 [Xylariaceae sp. FL0804]
MIIMAGALVGYFLACAGGLIFASNPIEAQWKFWIPSTTIHEKDFWLAMAIVNIALDISLLCIPQTRVWKLQLSRQRKTLVSLIFMLGAFVCIASIVRIVYLLKIDVSDVTYTFSVPGIWTLVEMDTSIICACLPVFPGLLRASKNSKKLGMGVSGQTYLRSTKNKSAGYTDLELSTGPGYHTSVESRFDHADEEAEGPVRVQRDFVP